MAFKIAPVDQIKQVVKIKGPADNDRTTDADFLVTFRKRPVSEQRTLIKSLQVEEVEDRPDDDILLTEDIIDIDGLLGPDGEKIEYGPSVLDQLLEMEYVRIPLMQMWIKVNMGKEFYKAYREKNL